MAQDVANYSLTGSEDLLAQLGYYQAVLPEEVLYQLGLESETILSESKREAPWDTTHMIQSGTVEPAERDGRPGFEIGYNATSKSGYHYDIRQHEDLTLHHPKPGTKAKFLEDPFNRHAPLVVPNIVARISMLYQQGIPSMTGLRASTRANMGNLLGRFG